MKKKKICLILNIITLCLCMGVIAVGVYSLRKSALNVGGSIGFVSHNLNVKYSGEVSNAINKDGTVYSNNITKETDLSNKWSLGEMYFNESTDYISLPYGEKFPKSIEVTIKIYNYSAFAIKANLVEDVNVTKTKLEENGITMDFINNPYIAPAKTPDSVATVGEVKIIFTLVYKEEVGGSGTFIDGREMLSSSPFDFGNVTLNVEQTKNTPTEIKYGEIVIYDSNGNINTYNAYYVEMGKYASWDANISDSKIAEGDAAKWVIYRIVENGKEVTLNSLDDVKNYINDNNGHYEAKENVKYYCLFSSTTNVQYCNNFYYDTDSALVAEKEYVTLSKNEYGQLWTDYSTSNIKNYLDGNTVKQKYAGTQDSNNNYYYFSAGTNKNFYDDYELTNDLLFNKVQCETINDFVGTYYTSIEQKFWVCSLEEIKTAYNLGVKGNLVGCYLLTRTCDENGYITYYNIESGEEIITTYLTELNGRGPMISFAFMG